MEPKKGKITKAEPKNFSELDWVKVYFDNGKIINLSLLDTFYIEELCSECFNNMTGNFCSNCGRDLRK